MRNIIFSIFIIISLITCEKSNDKPIQISTDFSLKILEGYSVRAIAFDTKGNAWIGTNKQGLIKFNSFETIIYNSLNSIINDSALIYDIAIDNKNNIWICSDELIKYDGKKFEIYNSKNTEFLEDYIQSVSIDSKGNIWLITCTFGNCRLVMYDGNSWTLFTSDTFENCPTNYVSNFAIDNNDNIWFPLINSSFSRLVKYTDDGWTLFTDQDLGIPYLSYIQINSKNEVIGANDFSFIANSINPYPEIIIFNGISSEKLKYDSIADIKRLYVDNMDNIWVLNYQGGFAQYNGKSWIKKEIFVKDMDLDLNTIKQSNDNRIWIGTNNGIYINNANK